MGEFINTSSINAEQKGSEEDDKFDSAVAEILSEYEKKTPFEQKVMREIIIGNMVSRDSVARTERMSHSHKPVSVKDMKERFEHYFNNSLNCGGFALEVYGCFFTHTKSAEEAVKRVLETAPFARLRQDNDDVPGPDEYRVLYRHQEGGFSHHFVKEENGKLIEKDGSGPVKDFVEWPENLKDAPEVEFIVNRNHDIQQYDEDGLPKGVFYI